MAGSPCPIEVMKQVLTKLHMPQVTVNTESGTPNDSFLLNALKTLFRLSRVLLDL